MATWNLSPQYKKSAVEKMFFYKDGKCITIEQGFRWANFTVQSDERPLTDYELKNEDGYELGSIDNDESWEMQDMSDGCWCDIELGNDKTTSTDLEEFEAAWNEDWYSGVEAIGWNNDDTEYYYYGPLELTNEDTGEVFQGEPDNAVQQIDPESSTPLEEIAEMKLEEEEKSVTDWFPVTVDPVRAGTYQVIDAAAEICWPFPSNVTAGVWDGKKWDKTVAKWRGLAKDPSQ
jgi:hypothetical protein